MIISTLFQPAPAGPAEGSGKTPGAKTMAVPAEVQERVGEMKNLEGVSDDELKAIIKEYYDKYVTISIRKQCHSVSGTNYFRAENA